MPERRFPTYLGLPLSNNKLRLSAFAPNIAKCDRYLAGWQSALLHQMGRATLVNSVLDSQLVYAMAALEIPPGVIDQVDRRRRSFLWSGSEAAAGSKCMVAWTHVCDTKDGWLKLERSGNSEHLSPAQDDPQAAFQQRLVVGKLGSAECVHRFPHWKLAWPTLGHTEITAAHLQGYHYGHDCRRNYNVLLV